MLQIALQLVAAVALLVLAIRTQLSIRRTRNKDWRMILSDFRSGHRRLSELSALARKCVDAGSSDSEKWQSFGGIKSLWRIYSNTEVLVEAIDFVRINCRSTPDTGERLRKARAEALDVQKSIVILIFRKIVSPTGTPPQSLLASAVSAYTGSIFRFSMLLNDVSPHLLRSYRYFVTRDSLLG